MGDGAKAPSPDSAVPQREFKRMRWLRLIPPGTLPGPLLPLQPQPPAFKANQGQNRALGPQEQNQVLKEPSCRSRSQKKRATISKRSA